MLSMRKWKLKVALALGAVALALVWLASEKEGAVAETANEAERAIQSKAAAPLRDSTGQGGVNSTTSNAQSEPAGSNKTVAQTHLSSPSADVDILAREEVRRDLPWLSGVDPLGIPFPTSDSVNRACEEMEHLGSANCQDHYSALAKLASEPRDEEWAASIAKSILSVVASQPEFFIRSLDCRTTLCAVEIESTIGAFDRHEARKLDKYLVRVDRVYGYERNNSNQRVTVTSMTFRRR